MFASMESRIMSPHARISRGSVEPTWRLSRKANIAVIGPLAVTIAQDKLGLIGLLIKICHRCRSEALVGNMSSASSVRRRSSNKAARFVNATVRGSEAEE